MTLLAKSCEMDKTGCSWKSAFKGFLWATTFMTLAGFSEPEDIQQIEISCHWQTYGPHYAGKLKIIKKEGNFFACLPFKSESCDLPITTDKIANLLRAIQIPAEDRLNISHLGIYPKALREKAHQALKQYKGSKCLRVSYRSSERHKKEFDKIFLEIYQDYRWAHRVFTHYAYRTGWTDDDPHFGVTLLNNHQKQIQLNAYSQRKFMLPWKIKREGKETLTHRPEIPLALYEILPKKYPKKNKRERRAAYCFEANRGRLKVDPYGMLTSLLGRDPLSGEVDVEWKRRLSEKALGQTYRKVKQSYKIKRSEVYAGENPKWEAHLVTKDSNYPMEFNVKFPINQLEQEPDDFVVSWLNKTKKKIRAIPWLKKIVLEQPSAIGKIRIIQSHQYDPREALRTRLSIIDNPELTDQLESQIEKAVFFDISHPDLFTDGNLHSVKSKCALLPDGTVVLYKIWTIYTRTKVNELIALKTFFLEPVQNLDVHSTFFISLIKPDGTLSAIYKKQK